MVFENELIKQGELKVGSIYTMEILNFYARDNNCILIIPNYNPHLPLPLDKERYRVKEIINNCGTAKAENYSTRYDGFNSAIILER